MSNYYKSKCCECPADLDIADGFECSKCHEPCEVISMIDTPYGVPREEEVRDSMCDYWYKRGRDDEKIELLSKIKGLGAKEDVDLVTVAKIINRLTLNI
jgi:hypothetical protein